jgi:hypothetical protein
VSRMTRRSRGHFVSPGEQVQQMPFYNYDVAHTKRYGEISNIL